MSDCLSFCRPEEIGLHPSRVLDYIREIDRRHKMCHSFLMIRHGKVFAEGYWKPFHENWLHRMYSVSKTFVSAAIGMLADEGKIRLDDRIVDYFPDQVGEGVHPMIAEVTIRDMLMMATCHKQNTYTGYEMNWLPLFFHPKHEPDHPTGTQFRYETSATYTMDVLVQRLTGKTFLEYLKDKGLRDIGFSEDAWCVESPEGYAWGGSGVECTTRDLARFAMVFMNGGKMNGKQILSREYVEAATSRQIENPGSDAMHGHGYGYQIWRTWKNTYSFCGMGGQLAVCIPDKDFLFVCTSDTQGDEDSYEILYHILWDTVVDHLADDALPMDDIAYKALSDTLSQLSVNLPAGDTHISLTEKLNGLRYTLHENPMGMQSFAFRFREDGGTLQIETNRGEKCFAFGVGRWEDTTFPETHYSGHRINQPANREYRCLNTVVQTGEDQLMLRTYVIDDYFGNMEMTFTFSGADVSLSITKTAEWFLDEYKGKTTGHRA